MDDLVHKIGAGVGTEQGRKVLLWSVAGAGLLALVYYYRRSQSGAAGPTATAPGSLSADQTSALGTLASQTASVSNSQIASEIQSGILGLASGLHNENVQIANYLTMFARNQSANNKAIAKQFGGLQDWARTQFADLSGQVGQSGYYSIGAESFVSCARPGQSAGDTRTPGSITGVGTGDWDNACLSAKGLVGLSKYTGNLPSDATADYNTRFTSCRNAGGGFDFSCVGKVISNG